MFRRQASLPLQIARTVVLPYAPLFVSLAIVNLLPLGESTARLLLLLSMLWLLCAIVLVPALLFKGSESSPGSSDDDGAGGDGGGSGPREPLRPAPGGGGIPLPDARQSPERVRDHVRRTRHRLTRRTAREPERTPRPRIVE